MMSDGTRRKIGGPEVDRRGALACMIWAGTGVLWTLSGGVPKSLGLIGDALAAETSVLTFLQISDSHIGFNKPANPDALGTLREAIGKVKELKVRTPLPGERWNGKIKKELDDSQLIIFLITQNFIASDYIYKVEIEHWF